MRELASTTLWYLLRIAVLLIYFLPTIVATRYRHPRQLAIMLLNFSLGWTVVAWIIALRWALRANSAKSAT